MAAVWERAGCCRNKLRRSGPDSRRESLQRTTAKNVWQNSWRGARRKHKRSLPRSNSRAESDLKAAERQSRSAPPAAAPHGAERARRRQKQRATGHAERYSALASPTPFVQKPNTARFNYNAAIATDSVLKCRNPCFGSNRSRLRRYGRVPAE